MLNFLSNSLKFTNEGGSITLRLQVLEHQLIHSNKSCILQQFNTQIDQEFEPLFDVARSVEDVEFILSNKMRQGTSRRLRNSIKEQQEMFINLQLTIVDTGVGISKENLGKLFINFNKLDQHKERNAAGSGLGLSICKRIIE